MRFAWDLQKICLGYVPYFCQISSLVTEWVTEWVSDWVKDRPGSRDAFASKNHGIVQKVVVLKNCSKGDILTCPLTVIVSEPVRMSPQLLIARVGGHSWELTCCQSNGNCKNVPLSPLSQSEVLKILSTIHRLYKRKSGVLRLHYKLKIKNVDFYNFCHWPSPLKIPS